MRFHVCALPHTITSKEYNACAYTQKVYNFCKMMMDLGHEVYHYGAEGSTVPCTEHITIITRDEQKQFFGDYDWHTHFFNIEWYPDRPYWQLANSRAGTEINKRKQKKDFVCLIAGNCQKQVTDICGEDLTINVEFGVGYQGVYTKYRAFESYAQMHKVYVAQDKYDADGKNYDAVIPNYFDPADYPYSAQKDDYYLYIGRFIVRKGIRTAVEATKLIGATLKVAGQGVLRIEDGKLIGDELTIEGDHIQHVGYADIQKRGELMSRAKAVFVPTDYLGPFEGVAVEAMMCGTPVLTTDWGAFAETVQHGVTGYRCRTLEQWTWAAKAATQLDPEKIRRYAVNNYGIERVAKMYQEWFEMLLSLWFTGWPEPNPDRVQLDWLVKKYE